jgi:outer membrane protein assembly factor BamB
VVEDEFVAFNTESCELEVLTVDGESVWKHWLGDPLMSMPAAGRGRVFMAFPERTQHFLAAFDLKSGSLCWKQPISGEIITTPTLADESVYLTTLDGTIYCFDQLNGTKRWEDSVRATSSPSVRQSKCYYSQREESPCADGSPGTEQNEHCAWRQAAVNMPTYRYTSTHRKADYLDYLKRKERSPHYETAEKADAGVGFQLFKGDSKIHQAMANLGTAHVFGVWSFQGSKPFMFGSHLFVSMGDEVSCLEIESEKVVWKTRLSDADPREELLDICLTPPCPVNSKVFVASRQGEVYALDSASGERLWSAWIGEPIAFQPAIAGGRVYVPTETGCLYCLETEDTGDDGWMMWGATARHNGLDEVESGAQANQQATATSD